MSIRTRLKLALGALVIVIMLCFLLVTRVQFYLLRDAAYWADKPAFAALQQEFEQFYREHGGSWRGAADHPFQTVDPFPQIRLVVDGETFYRKGDLSADILRSEGYKIILYADDAKAGRLYVMNERQSDIYALKEMWYGIFPNIIGVSLVVVFFAAISIILLLTWRLTLPIRRIVADIQAMKNGEPPAFLSARRNDEFGEISQALKDLHASVTRLEQSRKQLMSDVAHELKTPLMIMQGELELAQELEQPLSPEKQSSLLDEVLRLSRLVHEVLDLSRLEAGVVELRPIPIDIAEAVEEVVRKTRFLAEDKEIDVTLERSAEPVPMLADPSRIVQALYNLMANALQYTEAGGRVRVRVERKLAEDTKRSSVRISIADSGIGIAASDLPHIFNRFYRADSSRTRSGGGSGLGLAIARQIVSAHGGTIEVDSEQGRGTTFFVTLPAAP